MNSKLSDLMAQLPADDDSISRDRAIEHMLAAILHDLSGKPVPVGAFQRLWTVSGLSAEVTLAYISLWMRQWFADADTRQKQAMETNLRVGLKLVRRLGYLRGAMTKVGQALASFPDILPDQLVDVLDRLHFDAPPMHFSLVAEMVENELGGAPSDVFARFDPEPFAAASLGQVHHARLHSGRDVAVKIQYPAIARAIEADFRNLSALMLPLRLGSQWESLKGYVEEIRRMTTLEVDYRHEAENLLRARELFSDRDGVVVPALHPRYSTERVLTMDFVAGARLDEFLADRPAQEIRDEFGRRIYRTHLRMAFAHMSYADPHSENYIFMNDGRLGLVDFGCVQNFDAEERALMKLSEMFIYQMRAGYGLAAVLFRLKARVDMWELGKEEIEARDGRG